MSRNVTNKLFAYMNGESVGELIQKRSGELQFKYHEQWLGNDKSRPISLSLPLQEELIKGARVLHFFDNLLPDTQDMKNRIQAHFSTNSNQCFDLLTHLGRDCVGALQLLTEDDPGNIKQVSSKVLDEHEIAERLRRTQYASQGIGRDRFAQDDFRISIAGAQEKSAFLRLNDQWHVPTGTTPTSHIFKLPIGHHDFIDLSDSVENEWLCHLIFKSYGLPTANAEIALFEDKKTLIVERFDRCWSQDKQWLVRLPQEDICQSMGISANNKYEQDGGPGIKNIMDRLLGSNRAKNDRIIFMKTQILFWLLAAIDGHAKNFSYFLLPGGRYHLTPSYDVMSAYPLISNRSLEKQKIKMAMAVEGKNRHYKWNTIRCRHWYEMAKHCRFDKGEIKTIINELCEPMAEHIGKVSEQIPTDFPKALSNSIFEGMMRAGNTLIKSC